MTYRELLARLRELPDAKLSCEIFTDNGVRIVDLLPGDADQEPLLEEEN